MRSTKSMVIRAMLVAAVVLAACTTPASKPPAGAPAAVAGGADMTRPTTLPGYLPAGTDMLRVMPPAPTAGDARDAADRRIFRETRAFKDSARWKMASDDAQLGTAQMLRHFSCAVDIELTPEQAPRLVTLAQRVTRDASQAMARAKDYYKRQRPYFVDDGDICRPREEQGNSYDYPSGHATAGWAWGLSLAQVDPEHATAILARGRAIGDSRVVCGVHNASAVSAARLLTGAMVAMASATREYQRDLAAAQAELTALRAAKHTAPEAARCEAETALVNLPVPVN